MRGSIFGIGGVGLIGLKGQVLNCRSLISEFLQVLGLLELQSWVVSLLTPHTTYSGLPLKKGSPLIKVI